MFDNTNSMAMPKLKKVNCFL